MEYTITSPEKFAAEIFKLQQEGLVHERSKDP